MISYYLSVGLLDLQRFLPLMLHLTHALLDGLQQLRLLTVVVLLLVDHLLHLQEQRVAVESLLL